MRASVEYASGRSSGPTDPESIARWRCEAAVLGSFSCAATRPRPTSAAHGRRRVARVVGLAQKSGVRIARRLGLAVDAEPQLRVGEPELTRVDVAKLGTGFEVLRRDAELPGERRSAFTDGRRVPASIREMYAYETPGPANSRCESPAPGAGGEVSPRRALPSRDDNPRIMDERQDSVNGPTRLDNKRPRPVSVRPVLRPAPVTREGKGGGIDEAAILRGSRPSASSCWQR